MAICLKNIMEEVVLQKLEEVIDSLDCCHCERCKLDIASYALNQLPSAYVATGEGEIFVKVDSVKAQHTVDVLAMIVQGAEVVKNKPRH